MSLSICVAGSTGLNETWAVKAQSASRPQGHGCFRGFQIERFNPALIESTALPLEVNFASSANGPRHETSSKQKHKHVVQSYTWRKICSLFTAVLITAIVFCLSVGVQEQQLEQNEPFPASDEDVRMFTLWYLWSRTHCLFIVVRSRPRLMRSLNILFVWRLFIIVTVLLNAGPRAGPVKYARRRLRADIGSLAALSPPRPPRPGSSPINKHQLITSWEERKPWPEQRRPSETELGVFSVFSRSRLMRSCCGSRPLSHFTLRGMFQVRSGWWIHQVGFLPSHFQCCALCAKMWFWLNRKLAKFAECLELPGKIKT